MSMQTIHFTWSNAVYKSNQFARCLFFLTINYTHYSEEHATLTIADWLISLFYIRLCSFKRSAIDNILHGTVTDITGKLLRAQSQGSRSVEIQWQFRVNSVTPTRYSSQGGIFTTEFRVEFPWGRDDIAGREWPINYQPIYSAIQGCNFLPKSGG